ncbi:MULTISPECIES: CorA family divalent cation transporter [unclassified Breznakia]|uniref:CorA family divalent cation transporter n=1 Tax=unclassified Breznakia TaxID=2623764 RepID=UPI002405444D|nr:MULTISPECIES: CorA family divalent cation transporter [unclassified Breznakia]
MIYKIEKDQLHKVDKVAKQGLFFIDKIEYLDGYEEYPRFVESIQNHNIRFESHLHFDILVLPNSIHMHKSKNHIYVYLSKDRSFFCGNKKYFSSFIKQLPLDDESMNIGNIIQKLLHSISDEVYHHLSDLENKALQLEDHVINDPMMKNANKNILAFRKNLLRMKRDYNNLLDIVDSLIENDNGLFMELDIKHFNIEKDRLNRNYNHLLSLMEYITEIREAYQSAVDNRLNDIMKLFTIISAIFLPLTLLVGWYGMNLRMPELDWVFSYPLVIVLSIIIVVFCIYYFRKKKWF